MAPSPEDYDSAHERWLDQSANDSFQRFDARHGNPLVPFASMIAGAYVGMKFGTGVGVSWALALPPVIQAVYEGVTGPSRNDRTHFVRVFELEDRIRHGERAPWNELVARSTELAKKDVAELHAYHALPPQEKALRSAVSGLKQGAILYAAGFIPVFVFYGGVTVLASALERMFR